MNGCQGRTATVLPCHPTSKSFLEPAFQYPTRLTGYWEVCPDPSYLSPPDHLWGDVWTIRTRWKQETSTAPEGIGISPADQNCRRSLSHKQNATAKKTVNRILHIKRGV
jgi:hypothetical protein